MKKMIFHHDQVEFIPEMQINLMLKINLHVSYINKTKNKHSQQIK
jgi:hypothetical protein